jgi:hypothetical protein
MPKWNLLHAVVHQKHVFLPDWGSSYLKNVRPRGLMPSIFYLFVCCSVGRSLNKTM